MLQRFVSPLVATLTFNDEAKQYVVAIVLRPGNSPAKRGAVGLLRTLLRRLRRAFPGRPCGFAWMAALPGMTGWTFLEAEQWST